MENPIEDISNHGSTRPKLWLLRHGETEWSMNGQHTGLSDVPLTADGEKMAAALRPRLAHLEFGLLLTSPLRRAQHTAELAGFAHASIEPQAVEWDYGDYEGLTTEQIHRTAPGWSVFSDGAPEGESVAEVSARAEAVIDRVRMAGMDNALLVAHSHFLRVLAARWLELAPEAGHHFLIGTGKVCTLGWDRDTPAVLAWSI